MAGIDTLRLRDPASAEAMKRADERARLENDLEQIAEGVKRIQRLRDEIAKVEKHSSDMCDAIVGDQDFGRGIAVKVAVAKADVIEQLQIGEAEHRLTVESALARVQAFLKKE